MLATLSPSSSLLTSYSQSAIIYFSQQFGVLTALTFEIPPRLVNLLSVDASGCLIFGNKLLHELNGLMCFADF